MLKTHLSENFSHISEELELLGATGCELLRVAIPDEKAIPLIEKIKNITTIPLMADIHFSEKLALKAIEDGIDSIRINPGNMGMASTKRIVREAKFNRIPIRLGINAASFKEPTGKGKKVAVKLVNILLNIIREIEKEEYYDVIVSIKSSDVPTTIWANEELVKKVSYPVHIGITEAGIPPEGIVKSSVGLGVLLAEGIGDTLRVSLTDKSYEEVKVGYSILKALNLRTRGVEIISCPTCGRCRLDVQNIVREVEKRTRGLKDSIKIAVMGCEVNGPGEAKDADIGIAGGVGCGLLFKKGKVLKKVREEEVVNELLKELEKNT